jgi:threonine/homoserine/homoserine lactone efflux protein
MNPLVTGLVAFIGAAFVVSLVPGPSTVMIIRQSVRSGRRAGMATMLGNEVGVLVWGLAAMFGLSALLVASRLAYDGMRLAGAAVLVVFGVRALWHARRGGGAGEAMVEGGGGGGEVDAFGWAAFRSGVVTNLANPKAGVFAVSFLPQFVPHGVPVAPALVVLSVVWALTDAAWYSVVVWLAGRARAVLTGPALRRRLEQVSAVVLIGVGVSIAADSA